MKPFYVHPAVAAAILAEEVDVSRSEAFFYVGRAFHSGALRHPAEAEELRREVDSFMTLPME